MIDRTLTNVWTVTLYEDEVFNRTVDESLQTAERVAGQAPTSFISDDDKATFHRYYLAALSELNMLLARRTTRVGGGIVTDTENHKTVYTLPMTDNHESELLHPLASHCLEFMIAKILEKWYGHGTDFGSETQKNAIRSIIHYRRFPIERQVSPLF